jgi:hypothetical protein
MLVAPWEVELERLLFKASQETVVEISISKITRAK